MSFRFQGCSRNLNGGVQAVLLQRENRTYFQIAALGRQIAYAIPDRQLDLI